MPGPMTPKTDERMERMTMQPGPCVLCGDTGYPLSMGGASICPTCDMGATNPAKLLAHNRRLQTELASLRPLLAQQQKAIEDERKEMERFIASVRLADKTPRYDYSDGKRARNNRGGLPGVGQRWLTPTELAEAQRVRLHAAYREATPAPETTGGE